MANVVARKLRKALTPQEVKIWNHLRAWRDQGFHFRRQAPRHGFVVDFVCLKYRLVVEIDGGQHTLDDHAAKDKSGMMILAAGVFEFFGSGIAMSIRI
jgi:very-short-patch-repair endonuclease